MTKFSDYRFPDSMLETKPGPKGLTLTYVDVRNIAAVLDEMTPGWHSTVNLQHAGREYYATVHLTVDDVTRADVGSGETPPDAANQAFRRAAAAHGLGRYLWTEGSLGTQPSKPQAKRPAAPVARQVAPDSGNPFDDAPEVEFQPQTKAKAQAPDDTVDILAEFFGNAYKANPSNFDSDMTDMLARIRKDDADSRYPMRIEAAEGKKLSQYQTLVWKFDAAFGKGSHRIAFPALYGRPVDQDNPPGSDTKWLIDAFFQDDDEVLQPLASLVFMILNTAEQKADVAEPF